MKVQLFKLTLIVITLINAFGLTVQQWQSVPLVSHEVSDRGMAST